jgi:hypothetical protein
MAEGIKASGAPVFAVFPKKGSGHRDISQLDAYIQAICAEPKHGLVDEQGEPMVKCHRAPNLIASERGSLCVRVNNWSAHHPDKATSGKGDLSWEAKDIYLSYSNVDSGGSKKVKAEATYF